MHGGEIDFYFYSFVTIGADRRAAKCGFFSFKLINNNQGSGFGRVGRNTHEICGPTTNEIFRVGGVRSLVQTVPVHLWLVREPSSTALICEGCNPEHMSVWEIRACKTVELFLIGTTCYRNPDKRKRIILA